MPARSTDFRRQSGGLADFHKPLRRIGRRSPACPDDWPTFTASPRRNCRSPLRGVGVIVARLSEAYVFIFASSRASPVDLESIREFPYSPVDMNRPSGKRE
jgi:hypothetical protein